MARDGNPGHAGVAKIDAAGRRWYTSQFKGEIVARCLQPGASVSGVAVEHGLNPNMVRKWIERTHKESRSLAPLLPVVLSAAKPEDTAAQCAACIEIRIGEAVIVIGARASAQQIDAVVRALR